MNGGECDVYERVQPYVRYERQVDHSGEIPRSLRRGICDFQGMDGCLFVYANDDWNAFEQKLTSLPLINKEARQFARFFLAGAATVEVDKQGRILLPAALREFAGLEKDVVLVGVGSRVEIWSKDKWENMNSDTDMDEITSAMEGLGLTI